MKIKNITNKAKKYCNKVKRYFENKKITRKQIILFSPSVFLILAGISTLISLSLLKVFIALFFISCGYIAFKVTLKISKAPTKLLESIGQIDGQLLIHKHKMRAEEKEMFVPMQDEKKVIFH